MCQRLTATSLKDHHAERTPDRVEVCHGNQHPQQTPPNPGPLDGLAATASASPVPAAGQEPGSVEYRHRPGALLLPARRRPRPDLLAPLPSFEPAQTPPGVVSGSRCQEG